MAANIGYLFYKEYFQGLKFQTNGSYHHQPDNSIFFRLSLSNYDIPKPIVGTNSFQLKTNYPGLLIGSGYNHETGGKEVEDELKLGFFFDHTYGLPSIPGSSIKGILRAACEAKNGGYLKCVLKDLAEGIRISDVKESAKNWIEKEAKLSESVKNFINEVFEGDDEDTVMHQRDVFFDAFPIASGNANHQFLGNDYITPHKDPLKDPNPIQFLKVQSEVMYQFSFRLGKLEMMEKDLKLELFKQIILDLGIGAKTNVGYGQFSDKEIDNSTTPVNLGREDERLPEPPRQLPTKKNYDIPLNKFANFSKDKQLLTEITSIENGEVEFLLLEHFNLYKPQADILAKFIKDVEKRTKTNKSIDYEELKVGTIITISINDSLNSADDNLNFTVIPNWK